MASAADSLATWYSKISLPALHRAPRTHLEAIKNRTIASSVSTPSTPTAPTPTGQGSSGSPDQFGPAEDAGELGIC